VVSRARAARPAIDNRQTTALRYALENIVQIDNADQHSLSRSYGVPVDVAGRLIRDEKMRRVMSK
jgi:hypothetical protein